MTPTDAELLTCYVRDRSEQAFEEIVLRHLGLVYCAALRQVQSRQLAEEVAQGTFIKLPQFAHELKSNTVLSAWLYQVTRHQAIDLARKEGRRQSREQIAYEARTMQTDPPNWSDIEPLLDEAMAALDAKHRIALLLRYFENKSLREVGLTLGTSESAAQRRVARATEQILPDVASSLEPMPLRLL